MAKHRALGSNHLLSQARVQSQRHRGEECASCGEVGDESCPSSQRSCGHHCNHSWTHDVCHWCHCNHSWTHDVCHWCDLAFEPTWRAPWENTVA